MCSNFIEDLSDKIIEKLEKQNKELEGLRYLASQVIAKFVMNVFVVTIIIHALLAVKKFATLIVLKGFMSN